MDCEPVLKTDAEPIADPVEQCVLSHSGRMMVWSTVSGLLRLMSLSKKEIKVLGHHSDAKVNVLKFSPSDVLIVSASAEGCVKVCSCSTSTSCSLMVTNSL